MGIEQAEGQPVGAVVKVKRQKDHVLRHPLGRLGHHHRVGAARYQADILPPLNTHLGTEIGVDLDKRDRAVLVVVADLAGLGATVPMLDQATGIEPDGIFLIRHLIVIDKRQRDQLRLAVRVAEAGRFGVEALAAFWRRLPPGHLLLGVGPLDATALFDQLVVHAGDIRQPPL